MVSTDSKEFPMSLLLKVLNLIAAVLNLLDGNAVSSRQCFDDEE
jgi:hypothetical protein